MPVAIITYAADCFKYIPLQEEIFHCLEYQKNADLSGTFAFNKGFIPKMRKSRLKINFKPHRDISTRELEYPSSEKKGFPYVDNCGVPLLIYLL